MDADLTHVPITRRTFLAASACAAAGVVVTSSADAASDQTWTPGVVEEVSTGQTVDLGSLPYGPAAGAQVDVSSSTVVRASLLPGTNVVVQGAWDSNVIAAERIIPLFLGVRPANG